MLTVERVFAVLLLLKAVDVVSRGPQALPAPWWALVLGLWVAAALGLLRNGLGRRPAQACWGAVVVGGAGLAVDLPLELRRHHLVLLVAIALTALVARDEKERLLLWRVQLTALYGVAALAKVNESFLGGDVLAGGVVVAPLWSALLPFPPPALLVAAGIGLILTELALAVTPWVPSLRVAGTALAAALHVVALLLATTEPLVALRLLVFGGAAVLLHAASAGLVRSSVHRPAERVRAAVATA